MVSEDEIDSAEDAQSRPEVVCAEGFLEVEEREGDEDKERDGFLKDFEVGDGECGMADAVGGDLEHVLEEGDGPAYDGGDEPGFGGEGFEMAIPCEGHEDIRANQHEGGQENCFHGGSLCGLSVDLG